MSESASVPRVGDVWQTDIVVATRGCARMGRVCLCNVYIMSRGIAGVSCPLPRCRRVGVRWQPRHVDRRSTLTPLPVLFNLQAVGHSAAAVAVAVDRAGSLVDRLPGISVVAADDGSGLAHRLGTVPWPRQADGTRPSACASRRALLAARCAA